MVWIWCCTIFVYGQITPDTVTHPLDLKCSLNGNAMMTRKDNDLVDYWNEGMRRIKDSGEFDKLCKAAQKEHGMYLLTDNNSEVQVSGSG